MQTRVCQYCKVERDSALFLEAYDKAKNLVSCCIVCHSKLVAAMLQNHNDKLEMLKAALIEALKLIAAIPASEEKTDETIH